MPDSLLTRPSQDGPGLTPFPLESLAAAFRSRQATIAVIGLGYVGLPLALALVEAGFTVLGLDQDQDRLHQLACGESPLRQVPADAVRTGLRSGRLRVTAAWHRLMEADAVLVCVPTPLGPHREPDLGAVEAATRRIAQRLRPGQLIVLELTSYPGTTRRLMLPILEATGLRCGEGFFLAHAPEREDPAMAATGPRPSRGWWGAPTRLRCGLRSRSTAPSSTGWCRSPRPMWRRRRS